MTADIKKVRAGLMSHLDYLKSSNEYEDFEIWCRAHNVEPNEKNAEFYFDQTISDYDPEEVLMEM